MTKPVCFLYFAVALVHARSTTLLSVQQLQALVESSVRGGGADQDIARKLASIELSERLTENTLAALHVSALGPKTQEVLEILTYTSEFLDLPREELILEPTPTRLAQSAILAKARAYTRRYARNLPDVICTAVIRRLDDDPSTPAPEIWNRLRLSDVIVGELSLSGGKESYRLQRVTGGTGKADVGLSTSGEFGNIIEALFLLGTPDTFQWRRSEMLHGRRVDVFAYSIHSEHSRFTLSTGGKPILGPDGRQLPSSVRAAYDGELFIDPTTGAILRVTRRAVRLPPGFPIRRMETVVEFESVDIGGAFHVLPVKSITLSELVTTVGIAAGSSRGGGVRMSVPRRLLNEVRFTEYHKFGAATTILTGEMPPPGQSAMAPAYEPVVIPKQPAGTPTRLAPATQEPSVTFLSESRLVELDVVVRDKSGSPVLDLRQQDFEILDEGKEQNIRVFKPVSAIRQPAVPMTRKPLGNNVFSNRTESWPGLNGVVVILVDQLNTRWEDQAQARRNIIRFLRQISPGDRVGIYTMTDTGFHVLHDYTDDSIALAKTLASWEDRSESNRAPQGMPGDPDLSRELTQWLRGTDRAYRSYQIAGFPPDFNEAGGTTKASLKVLEAVAEHLGGVAGRKNLIWISAGFPQVSEGGESYSQETAAAMKAITSANVAIYPVDARGLEPGYASADTRSPRSRAALMDVARPRTSGLYKTVQLMWDIADRTGGRAFTSTNDIMAAIREAFEDSQHTYTLGFYPDDVPLDNRFHTLTVKAPGRKDATVLHRKGYMPSRGSGDLSHLLREAMWSPLDATGIAISAQLTRNAEDCQVSVTIGPEGLALESQGDRWIGRLSVVLAQRNQRGNQIEYLDEELGLELRQNTYQAVLGRGLPYERSISLNPEATSLRIIVRDLSSGALGGVTIRLSPYNQEAP
jgi:VWFA-related protein